MPLIYYDTTAPTAGNHNSITRTAVDFGIRDFLLNLNIQNPIRYPQLPTSVNGSPRGGEPFLDTMVGNGSVPQQNPLEVDGVFRYDNAIIMNLYKNQDPAAPQFLDIIDITTTPIFPVPPNGTTQYPTTPDSTTAQYGLLAKSDFAEYRKQATIKNLYLDATKQVDMADYISLQPIQTAQQLPSYDEAFGQLLGLGKEATQAADILGSLLNGQGVGIAGGAGGLNLVPNFDLRSSLAGRVLGVAGVLNDTKLGTIGAEQLALALANNAAFNTEQAILGKANLQQNLNAILGAGDFEFPRPNYKITVSDDLLGKVVGTAERILGFTLPKSRLDDSGSLFFTESGAISNIDRANSMLVNTGKGQRKALAVQFKANLLGTSSDGKIDNPNESPFRSGYSPMYKVGGSSDFLVPGGKLGKPNLYAFNDSPSGDNSGAKSGIVKNFLKPVTEEEPINEMNWNREKLVADAGFIGTPNSSNPAPFAQNFAWTSSKGATTNVAGGQTVDIGLGEIFPDTENPQIAGEKKSLLSKTQKLFNSKGMMTMVSAYGSAEGTNSKEQIQTAVSPNGFISKGSGVLSAGRFNPDGTLGNSTANDSAASTFCRVWIPQNRYDKVSKLIRSRGLNQTELTGSQILTGGTKGWRLHNSERMSVLDDNGFVKIAPYKAPTDNLTRQSTIPKKYMFSIENLAWVGSPAVNLLPIEQGPGDLLTGKFGRIMWFPPYDLTFSESSSVNLESNLFIGRGEPLYTYNNTERTGQLSFKIVVDHPSAMNAFKGNNGPTDEYIRSWFAGCVEDSYYTSLLTQEEKTKITTKPKEVVNEKTIPPPPDIPPFKIYFKNDRVDVDPLYEAAPKGSPGVGVYSSIELEWKKQPDGKCIELKSQTNWDDKTSYALNTKEITIGDKKLKGWIDPDFAKTLRDYLNTPQYKDVQVNINAKGWASTQGCPQQNIILANERGRLASEYLKSIVKDLPGNISVSYTLNPKAEKPGPYTPNTPQDDLGPKEARFAEIKFNIDKTKTRTEKFITYVDEPVAIQLNSQVAKRYYTEQDFFEKLTRDDSFVFDKIRQKIRYFHPAFHSTTPEGLNSRLTFLLQCTRQGPTTNTNKNPNNLAFGPAPVCILRIGDFYNTKIMMDNLSIDYEPLVWDLNPEGIGVQPMIANVTISFKYIGGSSLYGPINKLQNALSFNYFANSQVYDPRADYIASVEEIKTIVNGYKGENKRTTFRSETTQMPEGTQETNYGLVPGLDSVNDSMGALENKSPIAPQPSSDQPATNNADNKQTTPNSTTSNQAMTPCQTDTNALNWVETGSGTDANRKPIKFYENSGVWTCYFNINTINNQELTQDYDLSVEVYDNTTTSRYLDDATSIKIPKGPYNGTLVSTSIPSNSFSPNIPETLLRSGNYIVTLIFKNSASGCEIKLDTTNDNGDRASSPCDTDGNIFAIGKTAADTSNPSLPVSLLNGKNYIGFYVTSTSTSVQLLQDYKLNVKLIDTNSKTEYKWKTILDVSKTFMNVPSVINNLYFSDTNPKTPELIPGNELTYDISFDFVGVSTACTYNVYVGALTNSQQANEFAISKLKVQDVTATNADTKDGIVAFNIFNEDPSKIIVGGKYKVKSIIKSTDGTEQFMIINKVLTSGNGREAGEDFIYDATVSRDTYFSVYFPETTPACTGFTAGKQYFLETILFDSDINSQVSLNKVNLVNTTLNATTTPNNAVLTGITGWEYVEVQAIVQSTSKRWVRIGLAQEGIYKKENGTSTLLITEDEFKALINKGINVKIRYFSEPLNGHFDLDQNLTYNGGSIANAEWALADTTLIGEADSTHVALVNFLVQGNYLFDLYYENNLIETIEINIDDRANITYRKGSAVTPAPVSPAPSLGNNKDAEVISKIGISKVYPYSTQYDQIVVEFEWNKTSDVKVFALESDSRYTGQASIKYKTQDGSDATLDFGVVGKFYVRKNDINSVVFGAGADSNNDVVLGNSEDDTTVPGGKSWKIGEKWTNEIEFDDPDEDTINNILTAQRDPNSSFQIRWSTGAVNNVSFYLDNTPAAPATPTPTSPYQLPYAVTDSYDVTTFNFGTNCDKLHAFQGTRIPGETSSRTVGDMNIKVGKVLTDLYNAGINPTVVSVTVVVNGPVVTWTATVDKSTDGKAWVGFSSRGSATSLAVANENFNGNPNANPPVVGLLENIKKTFPSDANSVELVDVTDFINRSSTIGQSRCEFWQKFAKYTLPVTKPAH